MSIIMWTIKVTISIANNLFSSSISCANSQWHSLFKVVKFIIFSSFFPNLFPHNHDHDLFHILLKYFDSNKQCVVHIVQCHLYWNKNHLDKRTHSKSILSGWTFPSPGWTIRTWYAKQFPIILCNNIVNFRIAIHHISNITTTTYIFLLFFSLNSLQQKLHKHINTLLI